MSDSLTENRSISSSGINAENAHTSNFWLDFYKLCLRKWWQLGIVGILAGVSGYMYALYQHPQYESRLTFAIDAGSNDGISGALSLAAQFGFGMSSGQSLFDGDNILEILKSRRIIEGVMLSADTFNGKPATLIEAYLEMSGIREKFNDKPYLKDVYFPVGSTKQGLSYLQDSILNNAQLAFSTEFISASRPDKKLSIYELRVRSQNEKFTKDFTDRLLEATTGFYTEIISKKDRETLEILEQRVGSLKGNVGSSIDVKASNQDANVNPAFTAAQSPLLKEQYNVQAYGEAYKEMFKTLEMARYQYLKKIPLLQIIDKADYPMKRIKPGKIKTGMLFSIFSVLFSMLMVWIIYLFKPKAVA